MEKADGKGAEVTGPSLSRLVTLASYQNSLGLSFLTCKVLLTSQMLMYIYCFFLFLFANIVRCLTQAEFLEEFTRNPSSSQNTQEDCRAKTTVAVSSWQCLVTNSVAPWHHQHWPPDATLDSTLLWASASHSSDSNSPASPLIGFDVCGCTVGGWKDRHPVGTLKDAHHGTVTFSTSFSPFSFSTCRWGGRSSGFRFYSQPL
jgi:hypothetical protein